MGVIQFIDRAVPDISVNRIVIQLRERIYSKIEALQDANISHQ